MNIRNCFHACLQNWGTERFAVARFPFFIVILFVLFFLPLTTARAQNATYYRFLEVIDTAGKPVSNATVETNVSKEQTDEQGAIKKLPLYVGDFQTGSIKISKTGYLTYEYLIGPSSNDRGRSFLHDLNPQYDPVKSPIRVELLKEPVTEAERKAVEIEQRKREFLEAAKRGDATTVQRLLRAGVNVNATDLDGIPAIVWAVTGGAVGVTNVLLEAGAELSKNKAGRKVLLYYLEYCVYFPSPSCVVSEEVVEKLLKAGADVNATNIGGSTPLRLAKQAGNASLIKRLQSAGAQQK